MFASIVMPQPMPMEVLVRVRWGGGVGGAVKIIKGNQKQDLRELATIVSAGMPSETSENENAARQRDILAGALARAKTKSYVGIFKPVFVSSDWPALQSFIEEQLQNRLGDQVVTQMLTDLCKMVDRILGIPLFLGHRPTRSSLPIIS